MTSPRGICETVTAWACPRSKSFDLIRIYLVGALVGFFFLYVGDMSVQPGAGDYVLVEEAILHNSHLDSLPNAPYGRDIGMALVWLISGFQLTHSLTGVVIIQVLMGL